MKIIGNKKLANYFRYPARIILLLMGVLLFVFGLLSGAENSEGITTLNGIINNSPNAIPGVVILLFVLIAWKHELLGGILITLFGLFLVYFFNFSGNHFFITTFVATLVITTFGLFFILSWLIRKRTT